MENKYPPIVQVDNYGKVIGPTSYDVAHAKMGNEKGIRHLTSQIIITKTNQYKEFLISRRGNIDRAGKLNLGVGGHAIWIESEDRAQSPLETALTETNEEIFYELNLPENLYIKKLISFKKDLRLTDPEYVHLFSCVYPGPFKINPKEVSEIFFMNLDELGNDLELNPNNYTKSSKLYLDKFLEGIKHIK